MGALLDLTDAVARLEARLDSQDDSEEYRRELLRLTIREAVQEALEPLDKRLDALEADVTKAKTTWKVMGSAVTFLVPVVTWLLPKLAALLSAFFLLGGCAAPEVLRRPWPPALRPLTVLVDPRATAECQAAIDEAVTFWGAQGVSYLEAPLVLEVRPALPLAGTIQIVAEPPATFMERLPVEARQDMTGAVGVTAPWVLDGHLLGVTIAVDPADCTAQTVAHELGHALGLNDRYDPASVAYLMWWTDSGGWAVSDAEKEAVR